jgi:serine/threonine protein kinase
VIVFAQVAAGLAHMHRRGVFHADLKPNNILYGKRGEVKIIDYGLAWIKGEAKDRVQGTPEYMAPETARSKLINERTDIYNFGATMYRLTTMKLPPPAIMGPETLNRMTAKSFASMLVPVSDLNKGVPKSLCDLIHKCLSYEPDRRPERMGIILDDLNQIATEMGTPISHDE